MQKGSSLITKYSFVRFRLTVTNGSVFDDFQGGARKWLICRHLSSPRLPATVEPGGQATSITY